MPHLGHWFSFLLLLKLLSNNIGFMECCANGCAIAFAHHSLYISIFWLGIILKSHLNDLSIDIIKIHLHDLM